MFHTLSCEPFCTVRKDILLWGKDNGPEIKDKLLFIPVFINVPFVKYHKFCNLSVFGINCNNILEYIFTWNIDFLLFSFNKSKSR